MSKSTNDGNAILEMRHIVKTFPGVRALDDVDFTVARGEIHAICGENGAGKSTLMKVLSGVHPHGTYEGEIVFDGRECAFSDIKSSEAAGIAIIHQELALSPYLSIAENIFLGNERSRWGVIDWHRTNARAQEIMAEVGLDEKPSTRIQDIGVGKQQLVEIAKALVKNARLLILDEPTAALNDDDSAHLLDLMRQLRSQGITCIMISHKLNEIRAVADSTTIIRDGKTITTLDMHRRGGVEESEIIRHMVGRPLDNRYPEHEPTIGGEALRIEDWTVLHPVDPGRKVVDGANIALRHGEIVGLAGLMGAGRTEVARCVFGADPRTAGEIWIHGRKVAINTAADGVRNGIGYLSEDRKQFGLLLEQDIKQNAVMAAMKDFNIGGFILDGRIRTVGEEYSRRLRVKTPSVNQLLGKLSGGNQQKVVIAKWLIRNCDVLIFDEPTRGIDVGAKQEIYDLLDELTDQGKSIIMISSEMEEVLRMSDRIAVMCNGRITGFLPNAEATQEKIMELATQFTTTETTSEAN